MLSVSQVNLGYSKRWKGVTELGTTRNGARTFLNVMVTACRLSHMPGFVTGLRNILGLEAANDVYALWTPLCSLVEALVANDNYYNQVDYVRTDDVGEDIGGV